MNAAERNAAEVPARMVVALALDPILDPEECVDSALAAVAALRDALAGPEGTQVAEALGLRPMNFRDAFGDLHLVFRLPVGKPAGEE